MKIKMTAELARCAAKDAANASMRKAGRQHWNEDDYNVSAETYNRLWTIEMELAAR